MTYTLAYPLYFSDRHSKMVQQNHLQRSKPIAQVALMAAMDDAGLLPMLAEEVKILPGV
jgi:hypothetical protein